MAATVGRLKIALTADANPFNKNLNAGRKNLGKFSNSVKSASATVLKFAGALAGLAFARKALTAFAEQELAVRKLADSLALAGDSSAAALDDMQKFASEIQSITTVGDEMVLQMAALGAAMAQLTGQELKDATKAAIGLAKAFGIDVVAAMRLVARAANGDTASLSRYGITLNKSLSKQDQFNQLLEIGAKNFAIAEGEALTTTGTLKQFANQVGDLVESMGGALAPVLANLTKGMQSSVEFIDKNARAIVQTVVAIGALVLAMKAVATIQKIIAARQVILQAFLGPKGWAQIAIGAVAAAVAVGFVNEAFADMDAELKSVTVQVDGFTSATDAAAGALNKLSAAGPKLGLVGNFFSVMAESHALQVFRDTATAAEIFADELFFLDALLRRELITFETYRRALEKIQEEFDRASGQLAELVMWQNKAKQVFDETRTGLERYNARLMELDELLERGLINWDTYRRAVEKAEEALKRLSDSSVDVGVSDRTGEFRQVDSIRRLALQGVRSPSQKRLEDVIERMDKRINEHLEELLREFRNGLPIAWK